jgi:hypothetical protein
MVGRKLSAAIGDSVLPGYSVFDTRDARLAAERMLQGHGSVRVKRTRCSGGRGQVVLHGMHELERLLSEMPNSELATYGLVLEQSLRDVTTLSVGRTNLNGFMLSYYGKQRKTKDNEGNLVYGGSDLVCVCGELGGPPDGCCRGKCPVWRAAGQGIRRSHGPRIPAL